MTPEQWGRAKSIFDAAMEVAPDERAAYVAQACSDDPGLEQEVQALVANASADTSFLESGHRKRVLVSLSDCEPSFHEREILSGRYRVVRFIGEGGMGEVYEVEDTELNTNVALKIISAEVATRTAQLDRFKREAQLARKVTHPNVCRVFDVGHHAHPERGDIIFLTMELLDGETLAEQLKRQGPVPRVEVLPLVRQMVAALAAAHQLGIIHRDFKPGNVMLLRGTSPEVLKVTDFGLARSTQSEETWITKGGEVAGTPDFMAPEQFSGKSSVETDVFSLGLVVYTMLTGKLPVNRAAPFAKADAESGDAAARVPRRWQGAIQKCLATEPAERYHSVGDFWQALSGERSVAAGIAAGARRYRVALAALLALVLGVAGMMWQGVLPNPLRRLPEQKHLAVLPFKYIGNEPKDQPFTEGIVYSLTSNLSQLERYQKSFWIVPSSDTKDVASLEDAHRKLNVTLAVTGTVQRTDSGLVLTTNLVDAKNHKQLASRTVRAASSDLNRLQDELWQSVADMVDLQVNPEVAQQIAAGGTKQPGAYELYEQGVGYASRMDKDSKDRAIELFTKAVAKDPNYALAYAGLGGAYADKYELTRDPQWIEKARANGQYGLALNGRLMAVHLAMGKIYQETGELDKALAEFRVALDEDPGAIEAYYHMAMVYERQGILSNAEATYKAIIDRRPGYWPAYSGLGTIYNKQGKFAQAVQQFKIVIDLAPDNSVGYRDLGGAYIGMGQFEEAVAVLRKGLSLKESSPAWTNLGAAYMYLRRYQEAADAMKRATELDPHNDILWRNLGDSYRQIPGRETDAQAAYQKALDTALEELRVNPKNTEVLSAIALYHAHLGAKQEAISYINRALKMASSDSDVLFTSALVYEIIGNREKAIVAIQQAVRAGYSVNEIEEEPELRKLRSDLRYQQWENSKRDTADTSPNSH